MQKIVNKTTKKLRIALIVFFLLIIVANSFPFYQGLQSDGKLFYYTATDMFLEVTTITENAEDQGALNAIAWSAALFYVIPTVGFFFALLDKERNLKNIAGILCSIAGAVCVTFIVGPYLSLGSLCALLMYLVTFLLSMFGIFARYIVKDDAQP